MSILVSVQFLEAITNNFFLVFTRFRCTFIFSHRSAYVQSISGTLRAEGRRVALLGPCWIFPTPSQSKWVMFPSLFLFNLNACKRIVNMLFHNYYYLCLKIENQNVRCRNLSCGRSPCVACNFSTLRMRSKVFIIFQTSGHLENLCVLLYV